jgi:hypothetical protein
MIDVLQCAAQCTHCYDACHLEKKMDVTVICTIKIVLIYVV